MKYYMCKNNKQLQKKLKVGDKVKISSLKEIANSPRIGFIECMKEYCGKEAIIKRKIKFKEQKIEYYKIDLDQQLFVWGRDMFEDKTKFLLRNE